MARLYGLTESDNRHFHDLVRSKSRYKRSTPQRRRRNFGKGGSGGGTSTSGALVLAMAMLVDEVPAFEAIDGVKFTCTPGMLKKEDDESGLVRLQWDTNPDSGLMGMRLVPIRKKNEGYSDTDYDSSDMYSDTDSDSDTPKYIISRVTGVNLTGTVIRGSADEPIVCVGFEQTVSFSPESSDIESSDAPLTEKEARFHIVNFMDLRGFLGYDINEINVPYNEPGQRGFRVGSEGPCDDNSDTDTDGVT